MDSMLFWLVFIFGALTIYRMLARRVTTPKARVTAMLRQYQALARSGLSEPECMFRLMAGRPSWNALPHGFLSEIVARLGSKENLMRFISLAEDYGHVKERFPTIASEYAVHDGIEKVACLLARLGYQEQQQGRLKEAEFVQKIALALAPDCYFTKLPLAATFFEAGRENEAKPLFKQGLAQLEGTSCADSGSQPSSLTECLGSEIDGAKLHAAYIDMYESCLKKPESQGS